MNVSRDLPRQPAPTGVVDGAATFALLAAGEGASRVSVLDVHFGPGARTRWHTHPLGQTLVVTSGLGWVQSRGGAPRPVAAGDVVRIGPGEEHWHGARRGSAMAHLAVQERDHRPETDALEPVLDADYPTDDKDPA